MAAIVFPVEGGIPDDALDYTASPWTAPNGTQWTYEEVGTTGRWTPYTASSGGTWGSITGTLSAQTDLQTALNAKQAALVSGTNIKTVGSQSLLGSGDLTVANIGAAAASHTHLSADVTDAVSNSFSGGSSNLLKHGSGGLTLQSLTVGAAPSNTGSVVFKFGSAGAYDVTLAPTTLTASRTIFLPNAGGTLMIGANNLSDITTASTARTNLGVDLTGLQSLLGIQSKTGTSTGLSAVGTTDITGLTGFTLDASTWYKLELHYLWTSTSSNFQINFVTTGTFERGGTTPALGQAMSSVSALATAIFVSNTTFQMRGSVAENRTNVPMVGWAYFKTGTSGTGKVQLELLAGTTLSTITSSKAVLTKL